MAKLPARRALIIIITATAITAAGVTVGVTLASGGTGTPASSDSSGSVPTATVVRTDLTTTTQVSGSINYNDSYTIAFPAGTSPSEISAAQQAVAADEQALSSDEQAESDGSSADSQTVSADQTEVNDDQSALSADQSAEKKACAGSGASSSACSQDEQKVSSDQTALTQAQQQLATAESTAKTDDDTSQGKVGADKVKLQGDEATLASLQAGAINPGTTYTWLPSVGQVIKQDQTVYSVSDEPVPLLYGSIPAYRAFYTGMPSGGDVGELTHDLIALGYGDSLRQSDNYSPATAAAAERWQRALGLPATGQILLGEVVFEPGPIRVTSVTPSAGTSTSSGSSGGGATVLAATGTTPVVSVDLPVTQEYLVKPGDAVSVVLPDGTSTVGGRVESVGTVATCPGSTSTGGGGSGGSGGSGSGSSADQSPCSTTGSSGSGGSSSSPTVTVTISLDSTPPGATLDQAPVNVNITSQTVDNVLAVPVNALLALAGGGYGLDVVSGSGIRLVGVTTGTYSDTLVQISGSGITAGMKVEVPSS
jgi:hypothetical protein